MEQFKRLLTSKEAAAYLCLSEKTLWNLEQQKKIVAVRMNRLVRYDPEDLDEFIQRQKTKLEN